MGDCHFQPRVQMIPHEATLQPRDPSMCRKLQLLTAKLSQGGGGGVVQGLFRRKISGGGISPPLGISELQLPHAHPQKSRAYVIHPACRNVAS